MNCIIFYEAMCRGEYRGNPERAKELYDYAKDSLIKEALQGKSIKDITMDEFVQTVCKYWYDMGIYLNMQHQQLIKWASTKYLNDNLRVEFDEEYVETVHLNKM